ncbi:MAG: 4Fe-4S dicluster domain-containing protein [Atribacterota bacterium]
MREKLITLETFRKKVAEHSDSFLVTEQAQKMYCTLLPQGLRVVKTPKEVVFPEWEEVYRFSFQDRSWKLTETAGNDSTLRFLFLLPCEAKAVVEVLDGNFLKKDYVDKNYWQRRKNLRLVILGCSTMPETCFCSLVGGSPLWRDKESIFVFPFQERLYVENDDLALFEEGKRIDAEQRKALMFAEEELKAKLPPSLPPDFPQKLYAHFEETIWKELTWRCINCGACTFLCPTCYCFDLSVDGRLQGLALKTWDSCMFPKFTLHASSHNPRPTGKERVRQRVMHKFSYLPLREGYYGCVGCGICREICPVNWDIREVVERMAKHIGYSIRTCQEHLSS